MLPLFSNCRFLCPATCALYETSFVLPPKTSNDFQKWSGPTNNLSRVELCHGEVLISQTQLPSSFLDLRSQRHIILVKKRNIFVPRSILYSFTPTYFCDFVYRLGVMSSWQNGNRPRTLASLADAAREHGVLQHHRPHYLCLDSSTWTSSCTTVVLRFPLRNNYRTRKLNWSSVTQIVMQKTNFLITHCFTTLTIFFSVGGAAQWCLALLCPEQNELESSARFWQGDRDRYRKVCDVIGGSFEYSCSALTLAGPLQLVSNYVELPCYY